MPVIVEAANVNAPQLTKTKFLAPVDMVMGHFVQEVKKHLQARSNGENAEQQTIFLFCNNSVLVNSSALMAQLYEKYKADDGFLYIKYSAENSFGDRGLNDD